MDTPLIIRFFLLGLGGVVGIALTGWSLWRLGLTLIEYFKTRTRPRWNMLFFYLLILMIGTADLGKVGRDLIKLKKEIHKENKPKHSNPDSSADPQSSRRGLT